MDLADTIDSLDKHTWEIELKQKVEHAASELRYMATSFTLKANFVPSELRIAELEKQNAAMLAVIEHAGSHDHADGDEKDCSLCQAVNSILDSTTAGRGYINVSELTPTQCLLSALHTAVEHPGYKKALIEEQARLDALVKGAK